VARTDLEEQFALARKIRDATSAANEAVIQIRAVRTSVQQRIRQLDGREATARVDTLFDALLAVERELYQVDNESPKDKIAYPIKLNDRLAGLRADLERADAAPTPAHYRVFDELTGELDRHLRRLDAVLTEPLARLNALLQQHGKPPVARHP
jgi:hypothetical protein